MPCSLMFNPDTISFSGQKKETQQDRKKATKDMHLDEEKTSITWGKAKRSKGVWVRLSVFSEYYLGRERRTHEEQAEDGGNMFLRRTGYTSLSVYLAAA